ncbi:DUF4286 family protein [Chitinophagaceae bacterium LWZ2-11]
MFIYNTTIQVAWSIHDLWVEWMKLRHIPDIMATGCFTNYTFVRLLEVDETEGATYAVQYFAESKSDYNRYIELHAKSLREDATANWGTGFIGFHTLMEVVN